MERTRKIITILTLALALCFVLVSLAQAGPTVEGRIQIKQTPSTTFPIVINKPGSYVLISNIVVSTEDVNGIEINSDNVTLDLNGHALIGPGKESGTSGRGIYASLRYNIAVVNGTVRDFRHGGIYLVTVGIMNTGNHEVKDIRAYNNGYNGIDAYDCTITNCMANYNGYNGIDADHSTITNCTANNNGSHGIFADDGTITNCTANYNGRDGISTEDSTITNCTARNNGSDGISASDCTITNCTASDNGSDGISASDCTITNCTAGDNDTYGIDASRSTITNCTASSNNGSGIRAYSRCRIEGNNLRYNGAYGLYLTSSHNYAIKNVASHNTSGNFSAVADNHMPTAGDNANIGW